MASFNKNYNQLRNDAINAALIAGRRILEIYNSEEFHVQTKQDESPLTKADTQANEIIVNILKSSDIPFITEEIKNKSYDERRNWKTCWIVDPLDGTKEFINRNGEFTVNIALIENQKPVLGIIYVPVERRFYIGDVNEGKSWSFIMENDASINIDSKLIQKNEIHPKYRGNSIRIVGSKSHMNQTTLDFIENLAQEINKPVKIVSMGSSLKFCMVASGDANIYPRFAPTMEWDTAAGQAICEAVGLKVLDQHTGKPMLYNRENLLNNYFVVKA